MVKLNKGQITAQRGMVGGRLRWNNWNNCGKKENPADGGGKEDKNGVTETREKQNEQIGLHSMESSGVVTKSVSLLLILPGLETDKIRFLSPKSVSSNPAHLSIQPGVLFCLFMSVVQAFQVKLGLARLLDMLLLS